MSDPLMEWVDVDGIQYLSQQEVAHEIDRLRSALAKAEAERDETEKERQRWYEEYKRHRDRSLAAEQRADAATKRAEAMDSLPARVVAMCKARGWSMHWTARGAYLHLEASELIEAIRGKHGDPLKESADVLIVLQSITESNGIAWRDVMTRATEIVADLETKPHYHGEEYSAALKENANG